MQQQVEQSLQSVQQQPHPVSPANAMGEVSDRLSATAMAVRKDFMGIPHEWDCGDSRPRRAVPAHATIAVQETGRGGGDGGSDLKSIAVRSYSLTFSRAGVSTRVLTVPVSTKAVIAQQHVIKLGHPSEPDDGCSCESEAGNGQCLQVATPISTDDCEPDIGQVPGIAACTPTGMYATVREKIITTWATRLSISLADYIFFYGQ